MALKRIHLVTSGGGRGAPGRPAEPASDVGLLDTCSRAVVGDVERVSPAMVSVEVRVAVRGRDKLALQVEPVEQ